MNNAATSWPKPPCVADAVARALREPPGAANRGGIESFDVFGAVRAKIAALANAGDPSRVALGPNSTWAMNAAIFGCGLKRGDRVVTSAAEHNAVLRPLYVLARDRGVEIISVEPDASGRILPDEWRSAIRSARPALAVFTHASNVTGAVNDAAALCAEARSVGALTLVDASQTLGWTRVDVGAWGADMLAFTGHKYLLGPQGTGGLWVREGLRLEPHLVGGTGIKSDLAEMPEEMPIHLEAGTGNEPSFHGLLAALEWAEREPRDEAADARRLARVRSGLTEAGASVIAPSGECTPVVSFTVPGVPVEEVGYMLAEGGDIVCRTGLHCAPRIFAALGMAQSVRVSLSRFTTDDEVEELVECVRGIASEEQ